jgi:hypothetical protein
LEEFFWLWDLKRRLRGEIRGPLELPLSPVGPDQVVQLVFPKQDKRCLLAAQGNEQVELAERIKRVDQVYEKIKQAHKRTVIKGKRMKNPYNAYIL